MINYIIPQYCHSHLYGWWSDLFTNDELDWLQAEAKTAHRPGLIGSEKSEVSDTSYRSTKIVGLECTKDNMWVYNKIAYVVSRLNATLFRLELTGFGEQIELCNYSSLESGKYDWHLDFNTKGISRKMSLVCQLSNPGEYEGGKLQLKISEEEQIIEKKRGLITVFPSYILHRVTPVTSGTRQSLVCWITSPNFR